MKFIKRVIFLILVTQILITYQENRNLNSKKANVKVKSQVKKHDDNLGEDFLENSYNGKKKRDEDKPAATSAAPAGGDTFSRPLKTDTITQKWSKLFNSDRALACPPININIIFNEKEKTGAGEKYKGTAALVRSPIKQNDIWTVTDLGFGNSAYMFDYLDETLQKDITTEFENIWKLVMAADFATEDDKYEDPYALITMLRGIPFTIGDYKKPEYAKTQVELVDQLKQIMGDKFDSAVWSKSIDGFKAKKIIDGWKWECGAGVEDCAKHLIDQYDFNGDGRLNQKELILASFIANKQILGQDQCQNCYMNIIRDKLDPMFAFLDCDSDGKVTAEELWEGLKLIKHSSKYNFFKCVIDKSYYRTSATNDFLLKAAVRERGAMNLDEFRIGILTGYWLRHVSTLEIDTKTKFSNKEIRWPGDRDIGCEKMAADVADSVKAKEAAKAALLKS